MRARLARGVEFSSANAGPNSPDFGRSDVTFIPSHLYHPLQTRCAVTCLADQRVHAAR